ncbi:MAG: hypothetical protein LBP74_00495, partial [Treponema sp.]|nr:hypothetical protein [Treponema sp.]
LEQRLDTLLDVINTGATLGFSAVNMFGAFGIKPLFSFYESDEFSHSITAAAAFPKNEKPSWRLQLENSLSFYGFLGSELTVTNTFTEGNAGWLESINLAWTVPTRKTLLGTFYGWLSGKIQSTTTWPALSALASSEYERLRKETLEMVFDNSAEHYRFSMILGHESIIRILGRLYFSVFAKINCTQDKSSDALSFLGTIGTTLNISF